MNIKLSFGPVSATRLDLLVVVLDPAQTLHSVDVPEVTRHVDKARDAFQNRKLKREYYATLAEGASPGRGRGLLEPQPQELEPLGERQDLHRARPRLARDYGSRMSASW